MRSSRVVYERNFQLAQFIFEKVTHEVIINEFEDFETAVDRAKKEVLDWHKKHNPEIQTDYFKGPVDVQKEEPTNEAVIFNHIRGTLQQFPFKEDCLDWVNKNYPDWVDHIMVKAIIKSKQDKPNGKGKK